MKKLTAEVLEREYVWTPDSVSESQSGKLDEAGVKVAVI